VRLMRATLQTQTGMMRRGRSSTHRGGPGVGLMAIESWKTRAASVTGDIPNWPTSKPFNKAQIVHCGTINNKAME
jgi:hypothetical protein